MRAFPCSSRGGRGWPIAILIMDEAAHFLTESEADRTAERVWSALAPSTAQFGGRARLLIVSTPWGTTSLFAEMWQRADAGELEDALAQHATTADTNPTISAEFLALEEQRDPDTFRGEYEAEFLGPGDGFIDLDGIALTGAPTGRPEDAEVWIAGLDPALSRDPFGLALVGRTTEGKMVIGPVRALDAQGGFAGPVDEVAQIIGEYRAKAVTDQFSQAAVVERLREHGLDVRVNTMTPQSKTAVFQDYGFTSMTGRFCFPTIPRW